jgi:hypothetical protein
MDVERFVSDDHLKVKMKEPHTHRTATKGEEDGNAFEREPSRVGTTEV